MEKSVFSLGSITPAGLCTFPTGLGTILTVLGFVFGALLGTGFTGSRTIIQKALNIRMAGRQYFGCCLTDGGADPVGPDTLYHHFHILFIQAGIGTMVTMVDAVG